jgi:hypothetical protein
MKNRIIPFVVCLIELVLIDTLVSSCCRTAYTDLNNQLIKQIGLSHVETAPEEIRTPSFDLEQSFGFNLLYIVILTVAVLFSDTCWRYRFVFALTGGALANYLYFKVSVGSIEPQWAVLHTYAVIFSVIGAFFGIVGYFAWWHHMDWPDGFDPEPTLG